MIETQSTSVITHTKATEMAAVFHRNTAKICRHLESIADLRQELRGAFFGVGSFDFTIESNSISDEKIIKLLREFKRQGWRELIGKLGIEKYMSSKRRDELRNCLAGPSRSHRDSADPIDEFPDITEQSIFEVMQGYATSSGDFLDESIQEEWKYWRPQGDRYVTNREQWKVSAKVIKGYVVERGYHGGWRCNYNAQSHLTNLDNVMHLLDGKGFVKGHKGPLVDAIESIGRDEKDCETDYFKVKCHGNGNVHLWFKRTDLLDKFNLVGCGGGTSLPNTTDAGSVQLASPLEGKPPASSSLDFFVTPKSVVEKLIGQLELDDGTRMEVLEPSAGNGDISFAVRNDGHNVTAIEINSERCGKLRPDYQCEVIRKDFLKVEPFPKFHRVAMNPPFSNYRDMFHVYHAFKFLRLGGVLVSVMSPHWKFANDKYSVAFRQWADQLGFEWQELPAGSFKSLGTLASAGLLKLKKPMPETDGSLLASIIGKQERII